MRSRPPRPHALEQQIIAFAQAIFCLVINARLRALRAAPSYGQCVTRPSVRDAVVLVHPKAQGHRCCARPGCRRLALQRRRSGEGGWVWWCVECDPGRIPPGGSGPAEVAQDEISSAVVLSC